MITAVVKYDQKAKLIAFINKYKAWFGISLAEKHLYVALLLGYQELSGKAEGDSSIGTFL